jgi:hypothetical protein
MEGRSYLFVAAFLNYAVGYTLIEPRVQTIKAKQDIWTGGPESLGAYWMTETGK